MAAETSTATFINFANGGEQIAPPPAGLVAGDCWVVAYTQDVNNDGVITPAGWTQVGSGIQNTGDTQYSAVFYKVATASEAATSFSNGASSRAGVLVSIRVAGTTGFHSAAQGQTDDQSSSPVSLGGVSVTTDQAGAFLLFIGATDAGTAAAPTFTAPSGHTGLQQQANGNFSGLAISTTTAGAAGAYTSSGATAVIPGGGGAGTAVWMLAFTAAVAASGATRRALMQVGDFISETPQGDRVSGAPVAHADMMGVGDDDHQQYHNDARGDARYRRIAHLHGSSDIQGGVALGGQTPRWSGSEWVPSFQSVTGACLDARQLSTQTVAGVQPVAADNLVLGMEANGLYLIECFATFQFDATGAGALIELQTPSGARNMVEITVSISTGIASVVRIRSIFPAGSAQTNTSSVTGTVSGGVALDHTARITGIVRNGANAGNCTVRFGSSAAAVASILQPGSTLTLWRLA